MTQNLRLMAVFAHPDDESLGLGATLAKYAAEGVETFLVTATRGENGRFGEHRRGSAGHPGTAALAGIREAELRAAARVLGVHELSLLGYADGHLDEADPREAIGRIAALVRRIRPDVVVTFPPDGGYGHPDHIAISQFAAAALIVAANAGHETGTSFANLAPHAVAKFYHMAWPQPVWDAYQAAFKKLTATVDGVERQAMPWPDWELTTIVDAREHASTVWRAISCHESQVASYDRLSGLSAQHHEDLWGRQHFYRAFSTVNGGRMLERDLFEGIRARR